MRRNTLYGATLLMIAAGCGDGTTAPATNADIVTTLTAAPGAFVGADLAYHVITRNAGPADAHGVVTTLTLPAGIAVVDAYGGTAGSGTVQWTIGDLAANAARPDSVRVSIDAAGTIAASAASTSSSTDATPANNDGSAPAAMVATSVSVAADVQTVVTGAPSSAITGDTVTLVLTVRNAGPSPAAAVVPTLRLSEGSVVTLPDGGTVVDSTVSWAASATLAAGDSVRYTVKVRIPAIGPFRARFLAAASSADPVPANNAGTGSSLGQTKITFTPFRTINGEGGGDQFGWIAINAGDLDGDGVNDVVFTAPTNDDGGADAGKVYALSSATGNLLWSVTGSAAGGWLGYGVDVVGDINGDMVPDIAAGAPFAGSGSVVVISGASGTVLGTIALGSAGDQLGFSVGAAGDLTGDGIPDILAGAPGRDPGGLANAGRVVVINGATLALHAQILGGISNATFGSAAHTVGDLNGDGMPEFGVGAATAPGGGRLYLYDGATGDTLFPSIAAGAGGGSFGQFWLFPTGDINGDGTGDFYAADINANADAGRAVIVSGASGAILRTFAGETAGDQFGMGRPMGDVNGDGIPDLVFAGWLSSQGAAQAGKIYVYSGTGRLLRSFVSLAGGETAGFDVINIGDVNGDGIGDMVVTAGQNTGSGKAYFVAGIPLP